MRRPLLATLAATAALAVLAGCTQPISTRQAVDAAQTSRKNPIPLAGKPVNKYEKFFEEIGGVKHFYLWLEEKEVEILKGVKMPVWAFNGQFPGPEIRVTEGDRVAIHLRNTSSQPHSIHLHGVLGLEQRFDGVPATSRTVNPGQEMVYEFVAENPGTHWYHCHVSTYQHLRMGMYGALIIEPRDRRAEPRADREVVLFLDAFDPNFNPLETSTRHEPKYFLINGKAFPETTPIEGKPGETVRIRWINTAYRPYSMHSHGYAYTITHLDGFPLERPIQRDVLTVSPGERYDTLITLREGAYPIHDHQLENVLNNGEYLGGATLLVIGKQ